MFAAFVAGMLTEITKDDFAPSPSGDTRPTLAQPEVWHAAGGCQTLTVANRPAWCFDGAWHAWQVGDGQYAEPPARGAPCGAGSAGRLVLLDCRPLSAVLPAPGLLVRVPALGNLGLVVVTVLRVGPPRCGVHQRAAKLHEGTRDRFDLEAHDFQTSVFVVDRPLGHVQPPLLPLNQLPVDAPPHQQCLVVANLGDLPLVHYDDLLRVADRGQAVRDDHHGLAALGLLHDAIQCGLHQRLALRVQRAGGLVQQQQGRVSHQRTRDHDALLLAAAEHVARHTRVVALRQLGDELVGVGQARRGHELLAGRVDPVADVGGDGGGEELWFLADDADLAAVPASIQRAQRLAVQKQLALAGVVQALQQRHERALPAAAEPHDGGQLPRAYREVDALQRGRVGARGVAVPHAAQLQQPRAARRLLACRQLRRAGRLHQLHHLLRGPHRLHDGRVLLAHRNGRGRHKLDVQDERCQLLGRNDTLQGRYAAACQRDHLGGVEQEAGGGEEHGVREAVARGDGDDALQRALVARHLLLLRPKRAHRPRQREDFLRYLRAVRQRVLPHTRQLPRQV
mmetsp:Transcript_33988/g.85615  ORF Transcript_33988/g.85615 Transcript_33988/m.85615 type:complete len:567 (-) Transcript_33988:863-2563(-)